MNAELYENPSQVYSIYVIENKFKNEIEFLTKKAKK
jgi:hypothetical protein